MASSECIKARSASSVPRVVNLTNGAPSEIMYMPGGKHSIRASKNGKPFALTVDVTPETAATLQASLVKLTQERAPHMPFFDKDHAETDAMAWPVRFFWQDGENPGVYCEVQWSDQGRDLVNGKSYRAFSPSFYTDDNDPSRVTGMDFCGGSLVNKPAFRSIAPIWSSDFDVPHVGAHLTLPVRCGYIGNPWKVARIHGDSVELVSREGTRAFCTPSRLIELVELAEA